MVATEEEMSSAQLKPEEPGLLRPQTDRLQRL